MTVTHRMSKTPAWRTWVAMRHRCGNPNASDFRHYGGRGIKVCKRWQRFENFFEDMGPRPPGKTLDRIDLDKPYCKGNCRWATVAEQHNNMSRNRWIRFRGRRLTMTQWADKVGIQSSSMITRLKRWPLARALTEPAKPDWRRHCG